MKKAIEIAKKAVIIISIIWTTISIVIIGIITFSGPSSCSISDNKNEAVSELTVDQPDFKTFQTEEEIILTV